MKDDYIKIRFNAAEKKKIKEMADNSGLTISSYIRYLVAKERKEMCVRTPQNDEVRE